MDSRGRPGPAMRRPDVRPAIGSHGDAPHARGRCRGLRLALPGPRSGVACALCSGRPVSQCSKLRRGSPSPGLRELRLVYLAVELGVFLCQ